MKFGVNLKNLRKMKKISQEKLAEKLGVSRQSVSKWETGEAYPEMKHILKICELFHCKINDLVHDSLTDTNQLDEEIHEKVVKFKKNQQVKIKRISHILCFVSEGWKIISLICLLVAISKLIMLFLHPISVEVLTNGLLYMGEIYPFNKYNIWLTSDYGYIFADILIVFVSIQSCINCIFYYRFGKHFGILFKNIEFQKTPFIQENIFLLKKMRVDLCFIAIMPIIENVITKHLKGLNEWGISSLVIIILFLFICAFVYIFEYGYEIQLNSTGMIYDDCDEVNKHE